MFWEWVLNPAKWVKRDKRVRVCKNPQRVWKKFQRVYQTNLKSHQKVSVRKGKSWTSPKECWSVYNMSWRIYIKHSKRLKEVLNSSQQSWGLNSGDRKYFCLGEEGDKEGKMKMKKQWKEETYNSLKFRQNRLFIREYFFLLYAYLRKKIKLRWTIISGV